MWVGHYDSDHDLRKLRPFGGNEDIARYLNGAPDVILLRQYKNGPGVFPFPVHGTTVGDKN